MNEKIIGCLNIFQIDKIEAFIHQTGIHLSLFETN